MRIRNLFFWSLSFALFFLLASTARAQIDVGNYTISGAAEIGGLPGNVKGDRGGYERYRDLPESVIVPELQLMLGGKKEDFYLNFDATKVGLDDQNYSLRFGRYGLLDVQFEWDQIPHVFDNRNAATVFVRSNDGATQTLLSRPTPTGPALCTVATCPPNPTFPTFLGSDVGTWVNANARHVNLSLLDEIARVKLRYTPTPGWTFTGTYWSNHDTGSRPLGAINGFSSSTMNISELIEPIDYQTHNIELGGEYAGNGWSLALKYNGSLFHNSASTLVWDNPVHNLFGGQCLDSTTYGPAGTSGATNGLTAGFGPCQGRMDLYPSNQAHSFTLTGTAALPLKTQFLGTVSYGWRLQDDSFLPVTINRCYTSNPALVGTPAPNCVTLTGAPALFQAMPTISASNLGGDVRPLMLNLTLANHSLIDRLSLKAYYRLYDLNDNSNKILLPQGGVGNDIAPFANVNGLGLTNNLVGYSKNTMGLEAGYDVFRWLAAKFNYSYERMHRDIWTAAGDQSASTPRGTPEALNSNNWTLGPTFDVKPLSSVLLRASYKYGWRDDPGYLGVVSTSAGIAGTVQKMFFQARRNEHKTSLFADFSPFDTLSLYSGFEFTSDTYPDIQFGVQDSHNYSPSVGFLYAPLEWVKLFGDYNWDRYNWTELGNVATPAPQSLVTLVQRGADTVNSFSLGGDVDIIKNLLGFRLQYSFSRAVSTMSAFSPGSAAPQAVDYPTMSSHWHELLARFEYQIHKNVALRLGYYFNKFTGQDYGVDIMQPWMGGLPNDSGLTTAQFASMQRSVFLGDAFKGNYTANVAFIALRFKF